MFTSLLRLIHRRSPLAYERGFVEGVRTVGRAPRNRRVERVLAAGWLAILAKCAAVVWLFGRYHVPVNPLWVNAPTVAFAALCTAVYLLRD